MYQLYVQAKVELLSLENIGAMKCKKASLVDKQ
jgi:hypothetical protein